jgi:uncharacterized membrane protein
VTDHLSYETVEDRTLPGVAYALYLVGICTAGFTSIIGVILAYANQGSAGARARSHYTFLIRTFWLGLGWMAVSCMVFAVGVPLSFILIGIPLLILAKLMFGMGFVWYALRSIVGVIYLARDEAYPRPYAVLL